MNLKAAIESSDPLSDEIIIGLTSGSEENAYVDYKESFDSTSEKEWCGLTKDIMAFGNTFGGYIVFGIRDLDKVFVGISDKEKECIENVTQIMQKVNKYIGPPFTMIRSRCIRYNDKLVAVIYIPESKGSTHIVVKEKKERFSGGGCHTYLNPGMIYVRRSSTNQILEPTDLESLIDRRISHFKEKILSNITKIIQTPVNHDVLIVDTEEIKNHTGGYVISDEPDAIPVRGMSFTTPPTSYEEEIAGWIAFSGRDPGFLPRNERLWQLYLDRDLCKPSNGQIAELVRFCLLCEVPVFFWLSRLSREVGEEVLSIAISQAKNIYTKHNIFKTSAFYGKGFFKHILKKMGSDIKQLSQREREFPQKGVAEFFHQGFIQPENQRNQREKISTQVQRNEFIRKINELSRKFSETKAGYIELWEAKAIDFYLYGKESVAENLT